MGGGCLKASFSFFVPVGPCSVFQAPSSIFSVSGVKFHVTFLPLFGKGALHLALDNRGPFQCLYSYLSFLNTLIDGTHGVLMAFLHDLVSVILLGW